MTLIDQLAAWTQRRNRDGPRGDIFVRLMDLDARLVAKGFPPMTEWWKDRLRSFYRSGKRWLVLRVGRRGGKSSTLCRVAVVEVLFGQHDIPPGDIGFWIFVSRSKGEAGARLVTIKAILDAIGERYVPHAYGVRLADRNVGFGVFAATIGGVSGPTAIGFTCDEMAKWSDKDTGANPARQVLTSLKPTLAGMPNAHGLMCSSAFSTLDLHHEMVEAGDTDDTMVAAAPTWEARPALTVEECRRLEPDEETMWREYGNRPMGSTEREFFDAFAVDAAVDKSIELGAILPAPGVRVTCGADLAFERNAAALAVCHASGAGDAEKYTVADVLELKPEPGAPLRPGDVIDAFAQKMRGHGCQWMMADGHYRMSAIEHLERHQLHFADAPTGIIGKSETFVRARVLLHGGRLRLPNHPLLIGQLKRTKGQPTPGGAMSIRIAPDASGRHGDILSAVVLAIWQRSGYVVAPAPTLDDEGAKLKAAAIRAAGERQRKAEKWLRRALR